MPDTYSSIEVCHLVGTTYRSLDYWTRTGLIRPSILGARGSGTSRRWSTDDVTRIALIRTAIDHGVNVGRIRRALDHVDLNTGSWLIIGEHDDQVVSGDPEQLVAAIRAAAGVVVLIDIDHLREVAA